MTAETVGYQSDTPHRDIYAEVRAEIDADLRAGIINPVQHAADCAELARFENGEITLT